ncbi:MAG: dihydrolipoamide acetyltransferase family protein, partial [Pseudomonadota bacterium]
MANVLYPLTVPKWGIEMQEGTVTGWQVAAGANVSKGDELIDIETDKIVNTLEAPVSGVVCKQIAGEGETLKVGELLGVIATGDVTDAEIDEFVAGFEPADASFGIDDEPAAAGEPAAAAEPAADSAASTAAVRVSPVARRLAKQLGVDLATVSGTGRNGRISKEDVERAAAASAAPVEALVTPLTSRRQSIARRLVAAKQDVPHYYLNRTVDMSRALERKSESVAVNALVMLAVAKALVEHPLLNSHYTSEGLAARPTVDINMAIDTEQGLVAPLLREVNTLNAAALTAASRELAERARANGLSQSDLESGGFTVSNLGVLGITDFTAIITPPQTGILAVGAVRETPVVSGGSIAAKPLMTVTLSADHRVVDGA